jgi:hypothetical protein
MTPCSSVVGYQRFGGLCCLHLQGEVKWSEVTLESEMCSEGWHLTSLQDVARYKAATSKSVSVCSLNSCPLTHFCYFKIVASIYYFNYSVVIRKFENFDTLISYYWTAVILIPCSSGPFGWRLPEAMDPTYTCTHVHTHTGVPRAISYRTNRFYKSGPVVTCSVTVVMTLSPFFPNSVGGGGEDFYEAQPSSFLLSRFFEYCDDKVDL